MAKFARILELQNNEQVLLTYSYNSDEDTHEVILRTDFYGVSAEVSMGFETEEQARKALKIYPHAEAVKFRHRMSKLFG